MAKIQRYGIKFPITILSGDMSLIDTNESKQKGVHSELMHLIFTPSGQRLRYPEFGTKLIQYIFNPNDNETWSDILTEIKDKVAKYIPDCSIKDLEVSETDNGVGIVVNVKYALKENGSSTEYTASATI